MAIPSSGLMDHESILKRRNKLTYIILSSYFLILPDLSTSFFLLLSLLEMSRSDCHLSPYPPSVNLPHILGIRGLIITYSEEKHAVSQLAGVEWPN